MSVHELLKEPFEEAMCFNGMNPAFVRQVWAKRRAAAPKRPALPRSQDPRAHWTEDEKAQVAEAMRMGMSSGQIAAKFKRSKNAVIGLVNRYPELKAVGSQNRGRGKPWRIA